MCIGAGLICFVSGVFAGAKSGVFISRRGIELEGSAYSDENEKTQMKGFAYENLSG